MGPTALTDVGVVNGIEIPKTSKIDGPLRGDVLFTTSFETTSKVFPSYGRLNGFGYLNMDSARVTDSENQWLVDLLKEAAKADGEGSPSQLLIECIGRYEDANGDGDISDSESLAYEEYGDDRGSNKGTNNNSKWYTYSYHADWIRNNWPTIYVKADWKVELVNGYYEITVQPYVSHRSDDGFDSWECNFVRKRYSVPFYVEKETDADGGNDVVEISIWFGNSKKDSDGNEREPDIYDYESSFSTSDAEERIIDYILPQLEDRLDSMRYAGLSGWQNVEPPDEDSFKGILNRDKGVYYATLWGEHTDDDQVYSCKFTAKVPADITLSIKKEIENKTNYSNNFFDLPEYRLQGTTFRLYDSQTSTSPIIDSSGNVAVWTISSLTEGTSNEVKLPYNWASQTVYLEETLPSTATGYKTKYSKAGERYAFTLPAAGGSATQPIVNEPIADPAMLKIKKVSPQTNTGKPTADIHYEGIQYTLAYFGERSSSESNARTNTSPVNTWIFETDKNGEINFADEDYFVSGNTLYEYNWFINYPVGWYRIWESSPANVVQEKGLEVSKHFYCVHIKNDDNDPFDIFIDGTTTEYKNPNGDTSSAEIEESRKASFEENEHWEQFAFVKKDIYLNSGKPEGDAKLEGAVFTVYSEDANRFADLKDGYDGHTYAIGDGGVVLVDGQSLTITITASGRGICPYPLPKTDDEIGKRFYIRETTAPEGYKMPLTNAYYVDYTTKRRVYDVNSTSIPLTIKNIEDDTLVTTDLIYTVKQYNDIVVNGVSHEYTESEAGNAYNVPKTGIIEVYKYDDDSDDGKSQGDGSLQGIEFAIVNRSKNPVYYNNKEISVGEVVTIIRTDSTGYAKATKLPYGTYDVYELSEDHTLSAGSTFSESKALRSIYANSSYLVADSDDYCLTKYDKAVIHPDPDDDNDESVVCTYEIGNAVVRGDIKVVKKDNEITEVQGDAFFAGIRYAIVNRSKKPVNGFEMPFAVDLAVIKQQIESLLYDCIGKNGIHSIQMKLGIGMIES